MMPLSETYLLDCMEGMKAVPDKFYDLALCDVPYGIGVSRMAYLKEVKTRVKQKNGTRLNANRNKKPYTFYEWDKHPPAQEYFDELRRISQHQIIFGIDYCKWVGVGRGRIIWDKLVADGLGFSRYETAYCSLIEDTIKLPLLWSGMQQAKSLSEPTIPQGNKKLNERRIHPTHKPVLLYKRLLLMFAKPSMKIIDTHLGGGSSRIACHEYGCDFTGYEINQEYFDKQEKRFQTYLSQLKLQFA